MAHKKGKKHLKAEKQLQEAKGDFNAILESRKEERLKEVAFYESLVCRFREILGDVIEETCQNIRRKQARSQTEI